MKIYLAASFAFPDAETAKARKQVISQAAKILRDRGHEVFVPHEHKIPGGEQMSNQVWGFAVMQMDRDALKDSDWVVVLTYGKTGNNAGVAWEAGYAAGLGKKILVVKMNNEVESMMMWFNVTAHAIGLEELREFSFKEKASWLWHKTTENIELS